MTMEIDWKKIQAFLDISEYVLGDPDLYYDSSSEEPDNNNLDAIDEESEEISAHLQVYIAPTPYPLKKSDPENQPELEIDILHLENPEDDMIEEDNEEDQEEEDDFEEDEYQEDQFDESEDDDEEEQEEESDDQYNANDEINVWNKNKDYLDIIEQEYERQHKLRIQNLMSSVLNPVPEAPAPKAKLDSSKTPSTTNYSDNNANSNSVNYYEFLTYRENNIEFYNEGSSKYLSETRQMKLERFLKKRQKRIWGKKISYFCRKQVADSRLRVKGRFITRVQANKLLGMDTSQLTVNEVKSMLEHKFTIKEEYDSEIMHLKEEVCI